MYQAVQKIIAMRTAGTPMTQAEVDAELEWAQVLPKRIPYLRILPRTTFVDEAATHGVIISDDWDHDYIERMMLLAHKKRHGSYPVLNHSEPGYGERVSRYIIKDGEKIKTTKRVDHPLFPVTVLSEVDPRDVCHRSEVDEETIAELYSEIHPEKLKRTKAEPSYLPEFGTKATFENINKKAADGNIIPRARSRRSRVEPVRFGFGPAKASNRTKSTYDAAGDRRRRLLRHTQRAA